MAEKPNLPHMSFEQPITYLVFKHIIYEVFDGKNPTNEIPFFEDVYMFIQHSKAIQIIKMALIELLITNNQLCDEYRNKICIGTKHCHGLSFTIDKIMDDICKSDLVSTLGIEIKPILEYYALDSKYPENWIQDGIAAIDAGIIDVDKPNSIQYYLNVNQEQVDYYYPRYVAWFFDNIFGNRRLMQLALARGDRDNVIDAFAHECYNSTLKQNVNGIIIRQILLALKTHQKKDTKPDDLL